MVNSLDALGAVIQRPFMPSARSLSSDRISDRKINPLTPQVPPGLTSSLCTERST